MRASSNASFDERLDAEVTLIASQADLPETQYLLAAFLRNSK
jgi:hypothetical protein